MAKRKASPEPLQLVSPLHKGLRQVSEYLIQRMQEIGAPGWESHLLSFVEVYGPCRVGELGRVFGYQPSTLTSVLDRLESEDLILRRTNDEDRRSLLIAVTPKGRRVGKRARRAVEKFESEILGRLERRDVEGFRAVVGAIAEVTQVKLREEVKK